MKDAFTTEFVNPTEVFNWDKLFKTLVKEVFTTEFVNPTEVFNWDKLFKTLVKEAFTAEFVKATEVFKINRDAFNASLRIAFP